MEIVVLGRKAVVSDDVREHARVKVAKFGRLAPVLERAEVRLAEDGDAPGGTHKVCEVTLSGHGHVIRARAGASDLAVAVDLVMDKLEHQVERLKGKLVGRSHPRRTNVGARA